MLFMLYSVQFDYSRSQPWTIVKMENLDQEVRRYINHIANQGIGSDGKIIITKVRTMYAFGDRYRVEFKVVSEYLRQVGILKIWVKDDKEIVNEGMIFGKQD
ncbi:Hypothetical_protein [Hexamita inflata]|uniref:Hypothetical_protein n=1 Tax=Hexamita inflata TaxID=28002 RepID=A0AA86V647_9EUKA|nr:Hypothetical protein HINF_LOCUS45408 [Hexamita inflata]